MLRFESAWLKIIRAEKHLNFLKADFRRWLDKKPYAIRQEFDPETGKTRFVYYQANVPLVWSVIVGELLYDLRSALDHVICELSAGISGTEFPIFDNRIKFYATKRKGGKRGEPTNISGLYKIRGITNQRTRAAIEQMQPFNYKGEGVPLPLLLHKLCNIDKHRTLHLCRRRFSAASFDFEPDFGGAYEMRMFCPDILQDRTELGWFTGPPQPEMEVKAEFTSHIAFDKGEVPVLVGQRVDEICGRLMADVVRMINFIVGTLK